MFIVKIEVKYVRLPVDVHLSSNILFSFELLFLFYSNGIGPLKNGLKILGFICELYDPQNEKLI